MREDRPRRPPSLPECAPLNHRAIQRHRLDAFQGRKPFRLQKTNVEGPVAAESISGIAL